MVQLRLGGARGVGLVALVDDAQAHLAARAWHLDDQGYPADGRRRRLHQVVAGKAPPGLVWDHVNGDKLDNRLANLEAVPQGTNARRYTAMRGTCRHGHLILPETTYTDPRGKRDCLLCRRARDRARRARPRPG